MSKTWKRFPLTDGVSKLPLLLYWLWSVGWLTCSTATFADETGKPLHSLPSARKPLKPSAFIQLPLKTVTPEGWLKRQLQIQANGLTGHLDEFWPDVGTNSGWLGGSGEAWERGPYFLDGLLPLAHLLNDERLLKKANDRIEWAIRSQQPNGQFGPVSNVDWWPRMIMCKALAMHYEATSDPRIPRMMSRYFRYELTELSKHPLKSNEWAVPRGGENILMAHWLYNLTGEDFLLDLAKKLFDQTDPWWKVQGAFPGQVPPGFFHTPLTMLTHGVNNAMGLKTAALMYSQTGEEPLRNATRWGLQNLMRYHGQPHGMFATDEHLNGTSPTAGCELCAVCEMMFTLEEALRLEGDSDYADRLETITYNALPAAFTEDMWAHQFDQQVNQVLVSIAKRKWSNNFDDANLYGLEPNYGCCTANMHQAWPKFVKNLAMATRDGGLALTAYGPCSVQAYVGRGTELKLLEETDYPFDGKVRLKLALKRTTQFPLVLHIPQWAEGTKISVNGSPQGSPQAGSFHTLARKWRNGDDVLLEMPMKVRLQGGHEGLVSVYRGPLLYGLHVGEERVKIRGEAPHCDYEIRPTTPWNYGLELGLTNRTAEFRLVSGAIPTKPWDGAEPPVRLFVSARRLPQWVLADNSAGPITGAPQETGQPIETIELVPYGSTRLRIAAFPLAKSTK